MESGVALVLYKLYVRDSRVGGFLWIFREFFLEGEGSKYILLIYFVSKVFIRVVFLGLV